MNTTNHLPLSPARKAWATRRANGFKPKAPAVTLDQALAIVKAAGYRVSKPAAAKAPKVKPALGLNAVGKPYGANFDPNYRVKHRTSTAHLFKPYGDNMRSNLTR
jgi:hypothetical protein